MEDFHSLMVKGKRSAAGDGCLFFYHIIIQCHNYYYSLLVLGGGGDTPSIFLKVKCISAVSISELK